MIKFRSSHVVRSFCWPRYFHRAVLLGWAAITGYFFGRPEEAGRLGDLVVTKTGKMAVVLSWNLGYMVYCHSDREMRRIGELSQAGYCLVGRMAFPEYLAAIIVLAASQSPSGIRCLHCLGLGALADELKQVKWTIGR